MPAVRHVQVDGQPACAAGEDSQARILASASIWASVNGGTCEPSPMSQFGNGAPRSAFSMLMTYELPLRLASAWWAVSCHWRISPEPPVP